MINTAFRFTEENGFVKTTTVQLINESELTKHDILCGRGSGPNDYCGNKHFLGIVAKRREEYLATTSRILKARIAQEVINEIHTLSPPGRFLERARRKNKKGDSLWMIVTDDKKCLEKVKQACRETWHRKGELDKSKEILRGIEPIRVDLGNKRRIDSFSDCSITKKLKLPIINGMSHIDAIGNPYGATF